MIYCVWYPAGGFGHFINAVLTLYGNNFVRPSKTLAFSSDGNSHDLDLTVPKYLHGHWPGGVEFLSNKNYCVLIDNGIANESDEFKQQFPNASIIKICYSDFSWPVIALTSITKAMKSSIEIQLPTYNWSVNAPWVKREKYFLYLRDHYHRHSWNATDSNSIDISKIYNDYNSCHNVLNTFTATEDFSNIWNEWRKVNSTYIDPVVIGRQILSLVVNNHSEDISYVTDIWTQAVVYYYIWLCYKFEVPHNDYANWFTNTSDISKMLKKYRVIPQPTLKNFIGTDTTL